MAKKKNNFYAYFVPAVTAKTGPLQGIADNWPACEKKVSGKIGARFRGFTTRDDAEQWLADGAKYDAKPMGRREPGIYFDAGTGRGDGVEISVTDEQGKNLLHKAVSKYELNQFGKHLIPDDSATNNYGELLALRYAIEIAKKMKVKKIFGDSRLVIEYWSKRRIKRNELPEETVKLAHKVSEMREKFESAGGIIERVSGGHNPADLGFHR